MILSQPRETPYDVRFSLFGIPVRVSVWFWALAIFIGWNPNFTFVVIWTIAIFLSILIHELGHVFAFRRYGIDGQIVLYHLGGLAIPTGSFGSSNYGGFSQYGSNKDPNQQIVISGAGPALQIGSALVLILGVGAAGYSTGVETIDRIVGIWDRSVIAHISLAKFIQYYVLISVFWGLFNLVPIYPLDGGQIARELFLKFDYRNGVKNSLILSLVSAGIVAFLMINAGQPLMGMLLLGLAFDNYMTLQQYQSGGFGRPW